MKTTRHNFAAASSAEFSRARARSRRTPALRHLSLFLVLGLCFSFALSARAQYRPDMPDNSTPAPILNLPIVQKPNAQLPLDTPFVRSDGAAIKLGDCFNHGKPVVLDLVYFSCPQLCGLSQDSLMEFVRESPHGIQLAKDYDILVVSIDPDDTPKNAAETRKNFLKKIPLPESQEGFTYLTGTLANIRTLADAVGFPFRINPPGSDAKISHDSGIFICTADGHLSQTILGVSYEPDVLHYRLREASHGKIGSFLLGVALCCGALHFDAKSGTYKVNPWFYAGTATAVVSIGFMATFLTMLFRGESKRKKAAALQGDTGPPGPVTR